MKLIATGLLCLARRKAPWVGSVGPVGHQFVGQSAAAAGGVAAWIGWWFWPRHQRSPGRSRRSGRAVAVVPCGARRRRHRQPRRVVWRPRRTARSDHSECSRRCRTTRPVSSPTAATEGETPDLQARREVRYVVWVRVLASDATRTLKLAGAGVAEPGVARPRPIRDR